MIHGINVRNKIDVIKCSVTNIKRSDCFCQKRDFVPRLSYEAAHSTHLQT